MQGMMATLAFAWEQLPPELVPLAVFLLRSADLTLGTLRMLAVVRGRRWAAWSLGFAQALLFVTAVSGVLSHLSDPWTIAAFAAGFATGSVLGIVVEGLLAPGHNLLRIVSPRRGAALAETLRGLGQGATEVSGQGRQGTVSLIYCYLPRRSLRRVKLQILAIDPEAFVTTEYVRQLRGGWRA